MNKEEIKITPNGIKQAIEDLLEENEKLKDNWNKLKEYCKENLYFYSGLQNEDLETDKSIQDILDKIQELEKGSEE